MTPPKEKPSWDFSEFLKWLAHHPEALEPGLRMLDHGLELGAEATVEVVGIDGLGRPCLMVDVDSFSPTTYDHILLLIARLKGGGERYRNLFARPTEPRLFLLAPKFPEEVRERLELLTHAFPLRCFRIGPPTKDRSTPLVEVEEIVDVDCPMDHLDGLDPHESSASAGTSNDHQKEIAKSQATEGGDRQHPVRIQPFPVRSVWTLSVAACLLLLFRPALVGSCRCLLFLLIA